MGARGALDTTSLHDAARFLPSICFALGYYYSLRNSREYHHEQVCRESYATNVGVTRLRYDYFCMP